MQIDRIQSSPPQPDAPRAAADRLEQAFLEEMLKYCGPKPASGAFGGGVGEDQFGSFLTQEYAAAMAARVDLGFAHRVI